ncbi:MAG: choice-of-anchor tandem repeat GloVer-containing protein [Candidatus Sulfotelmatobacter sp.]
MTRNKPWTAVSKALVAVTAMLIVTLVLASGTAAAGTFKILHVFKNTDGAGPNALISDAAGNLYGTTYSGGDLSCFPPQGCGVVFKLAPNPDGTWTESVLYAFTHGIEGYFPAPGLILDAAGNLYGATTDGGAYGSGVVFKLEPKADETWTASVLYSSSGGHLNGGLISDVAGNLYGTTYGGGLENAGSVFKLASNADGSWTESVLYSFEGFSDGDLPQAGVIFDGAGNLYGTTPLGGDEECSIPEDRGCGVVFKLAPNADGSWTESVLYSFTLKADGGYPSFAGLTFDAAGNLYGTTPNGGDLKCAPTAGCGVVFKLAPASGSWSETVLHTFTGEPSENPAAGVIFDAAGNLYGTTYGTTSGSGLPINYGSVFRLTPTSSGWSYCVLHRFMDLPGEYPNAAMIMDAAGNLYGTATGVGTNYGLVFEITP